MGPAATVKDGVVVGFVTVGTNQVGQLADGAENELTPEIPPTPAVKKYE
jgi:hypothetical protein